MINLRHINGQSKAHKMSILRKKHLQFFLLLNTKDGKQKV